MAQRQGSGTTWEFLWVQCSFATCLHPTTISKSLWKNSGHCGPRWRQPSGRPRPRQRTRNVCPPPHLRPMPKALSFCVSTDGKTVPTGSDWLDEINLEVTWPGDGSPDIREDNSDCHLLIYPATTRPTAMPAKKAANWGGIFIRALRTERRRRPGRAAYILGVP